MKLKISKDDISKIEGIEEDTAKELIDRAKEFYIKRSRRNFTKN